MQNQLTFTMKKLKFILVNILPIVLFFLVFSQNVQAQNLSFAIDRTSGNFSIHNEQQENVTALYEVQLAEFDIYDIEQKYVGTIQVKNNKILPTELAPKETLKISKIQLKDKQTAATITIDGKKTYKVLLK